MGDEDSRHEATLTDAGKDLRLEQQKHCEEVELEPGVHYVVKAGGSYWLPVLDVLATQLFRHTGIVIRQKRPRTPPFSASPLPRHQAGQQERTARLVMSDSHPLSLLARDAKGHVPYAGPLRQTEETWHEDPQTWLDGRTVSEEAKLYVGNLMLAYRVRPQDDMGSDQGNTVDLVIDKELRVSHNTRREALTTRIGGG